MTTFNNPKPIFDAVRTIAGPLSQTDVDLLNRAMQAASDGHDILPSGGRNIGPEGMDLIKRFEGLRLKAYLCPAKVWTIGYGSTGPHVRPGMEISAVEADRLLRLDLDRFEACVEKLATKPSQLQFDAMVSLAFNIGTGGFARSTVLKEHNSGRTARAADAFMMWNKAGGKALSGLTRRRDAERALYLRGS